MLNKDFQPTAPKPPKSPKGDLEVSNTLKPFFADICSDSSEEDGKTFYKK
jgi:hypothetical protein